MTSIKIEGTDMNIYMFIIMINNDFEFAKIYRQAIVQHPVVLKNMVEYDKFRDLINENSDIKSVLIFSSLTYNMTEYHKGEYDDFFIDHETGTITSENLELLIDMYSLKTDHVAREFTIAHILHVMKKYPSIEYAAYKLIEMDIENRIGRPSIKILDRVARCGDPKMIDAVLNGPIHELVPSKDLNIMFREAVSHNNKANVRYIMDAPGFTPIREDLIYVMYCNDDNIIREWFAMCNFIITNEDFEKAILKINGKITVDKFKKYINILNIDPYTMNRVSIIKTIYYGKPDIFKYFVDEGMLDLNKKYDDKSVLWHIVNCDENKEKVSDTLINAIGLLIDYPSYRCHPDDLEYLDNFPSLKVQKFLRQRSISH